MELTEREYAHWLFSVEGIGNNSIDKLLCGGISCGEIYASDIKSLSGMLSKKQLKSLEKSRYNWDFEAEEKKLKDMGMRFISRIDPEFPEKLRNIPDPPFAIYVIGELPDSTRPAVSVVGARMCSEYGRYMAREFGKGLSLNGIQVISGMARGIDSIAQKAALDAMGKSFAILGCGADICYPPENEEIYEKLKTMGGIISEYPPGTVPKPGFFPRRNRLISALSDILLVVEARQRSGTSITVDTALEQGKEILAVPGRVTDRLSDGCNFLISQGAGVAMGVEDVIERLNVSAGETGCKNKFSETDVDTGNGTSEKTIENSFENVAEDLEEIRPQSPKTLEEEILSDMDIIPVSISRIMENLYKKGIDISIPQLITNLMDMTGKGVIRQEGVYYRLATPKKPKM